MKFLTVLLLAAAALAQTPDCSIVPGWKQQGEKRSYEAENLFEYMDGNAEGYLIYRFVKMEGVSCQAGEVTLVFDVSEMADAESAYGIYCSNRDTRLPAEKIGMGGQVAPRRAIFAKDKYYVEVASSKDDPETVRAFARAMEKKIAGQDQPPATITWFSPEKLLREEVRLIPESVLGVRALKRGYIAKYEGGGQAFLVTEESPESARKVMDALRTRFGEGQAAKLADEAFQLEHKYLGRMCVFRKGRYIGGFTGAPAGVDPVAQSAALAARIP